MINDHTSITAVDADPSFVLTVRDLLVLQLLARGYNEAEIARLLHVEAGEVKRCMAAIQERLSVHTASRSVAFAILRGLIV